MVKRSIGVLLLVLASVCTVTAQSTSALRINEVLTNNVSNYVDPFGNRGAWIAIYKYFCRDSADGGLLYY